MRMPPQHEKRAKAFTLAELLVVCAILSLIFSMLLPAIQKVRAQADNVVCKSNLRQIGLALQMYHTDRKVLPPGCSSSASSMPYSAWSARLIPYIEQDSLWKETTAAYQTSKDFLTVTHERVRQTVVTRYLCPADNDTVSRVQPNMALLAYLGVNGNDCKKNDGVLYYDSKTRLSEINDGLSNTLMVGERPPGGIRKEFGWWYAGWGQNKDGSVDSTLGVRELNLCQTTYGQNCPPGPYHFMPGDNDQIADAFHFWSSHQGGAHFLFCDFSVRFLTYSADKIMPALATRNGRESVQIE